MDKQFVEGLSLKEHKFENGGSIIKVGVGENFIKYFNEHKNDRGFLNIEIKTSQKGNVYAELDTYVKPEEKAVINDDPPEYNEDQDFDDAIPF